MNQEGWEVEDAHTIVVEEDVDQGNSDPAKLSGGRLTLVSLPGPWSYLCGRCCAIYMWEISNMYGNDYLENSPPHLYLVLYSTR